MEHTAQELTCMAPASEVFSTALQVVLALGYAIEYTDLATRTIVFGEDTTASRGGCRFAVDVADERPRTRMVVREHSEAGRAGATWPGRLTPRRTPPEARRILHALAQALAPAPPGWPPDPVQRFGPQ